MVIKALETVKVDEAIDAVLGNKAVLVEAVLANKAHRDHREQQRVNNFYITYSTQKTSLKVSQTPSSGERTRQGQERSVIALQKIKQRLKTRLSRPSGSRTGRPPLKKLPDEK